LSDVYVLTAAAESDLRDIIRYTRQRWGDAQVRSYLARLQVGIERVALGQGFFKD
jgi:plasmid stabilization system protein ParE